MDSFVRSLRAGPAEGEGVETRPKKKGLPLRTSKVGGRLSDCGQCELSVVVVTVECGERKRYLIRASGSPRREMKAILKWKGLASNSNDSSNSDNSNSSNRVASSSSGAVGNSPVAKMKAADGETEAEGQQDECKRNDEASQDDEEEVEEQAIDLRNGHRKEDEDSLPPGPKCKKAVMLKKLSSQKKEEAEEVVERAKETDCESPPAAKKSRMEGDEQEAADSTPVQIRGEISL